MRGRPPLTAEESARRFWRRVDQSGGPDACWPWRGGSKTYGTFRYQGEHWYSHHLAYFLENGKKAEAWHLHKCGNTLCCNPKHIYDGTPKQNSQDRDCHAVEQGRSLPHFSRDANGRFCSSALL